MGKKGYNKRALLFLLSVVIWGFMTILWGVFWMSFYADIIPLPFWKMGNWLMTLIYGVILFFITSLYGGYRVGDARRGDIIFSNFFSTAITNVITYFQISLVGRGLMDPRPFFLISVIDFILIWIWATYANKLYFRIYPPHELLVVFGGSSLTQTLIVKMSDRSEKYRIKEALNIDVGMERVLARINDYDSILICDVPSGQRNKILKYCFKQGIRTYMTPKISDILIRGAGSIHLFDTPLLISRNRGLAFEQRLFKRAMDIILSALGLLIASPFMLLVALAVKLQDGGPILYKQQRLTLGGKVFSLYKFRSMIVDAEKESNAVLASKGDSRITPVGRFIRRCRLDELPQLINVIRGDMSLVGPRPERPELAQEYEKDMEEFSFRLRVKAGLTGYAQVLGKYNTTPYDKLKLDLMYIAGYSILLDIKLILMTIKILFMSESTEGVNS